MRKEPYETHLCQGPTQRAVEKERTKEQMEYDERLKQEKAREDEQVRELIQERLSERKKLEKNNNLLRVQNILRDLYNGGSENTIKKDMDEDWRKEAERMIGKKNNK